jgi:cob(II)yrinic acid a,c-diamide reductase
LSATGAALYSGLQTRAPQVLKSSEVEPRHYREAMSRFAGAVHVVTTNGEAGMRGTTVIAACSASDNPPTVLVCLNRGKAENDLFRDNGAFALNTLPAGMEALANAFSGLTGVSQPERFALGRWDTIATGAPTLIGAAAVFDCEVETTFDHATHRILFGRVRGVRIGDGLEPLIYYNRQYRVL